MYEQKFHDAGYEIYKLGRTNNRGDGNLIFSVAFTVYMLYSTISC
jgi:hypothetical protein